MLDTAIPFVGNNPWAIIASGIYFLVLVAIGLWSSRFSSEGQENFLIGGRAMSALVVGLSAVVSGRSAWLLLAVTGLAYLQGASAIWYVVGYTVVELVLFFTVARRLRRETGASGDITIPDWFVSRFGDSNNLLRSVSAGIIIIFLTTYVGAQMKAGGKALVSGFGLPEWSGILITGVVVLVYTAVGGFLAVSLTDVLQAFMMLFALIGLPIVAVNHFGGLEAVLAALNPAVMDLGGLSIGALVGALGIGLGSPGNPHILVRFMSIRNESRLKVAGFLGFFWNVVMGVGAVAIGVIGQAAVAVETLPNGDHEMIFPHLAGILPPFLFGLIIAAIFAAIMSTADSQLLVASSAFVRDFYERIFNKGRPLPDRKMVVLNRAVVVALCIFGLLIALFASEYVNFLVLLAWTGLGCSFGPPIILGLYWRKTSRAGALAGIISGTLTTFIWGLNPMLKDFVHEVVPTFIVSLIATVTFSQLYNSEEHWLREDQWPSR